ncbi:DUF6232 family protein [Streptomyces sp. NPDC058486]|uniref:DUF6232 family protein n=1 Tax=unclassified Streptomyces TaxID=2593676 RepID=UPI00364728A2
MDSTNGPGIPPNDPPPVPPTAPPPVDPPTRRPLLEPGRAPAVRGSRAIDLRVKNRVLWIGSAALPLPNVTSVEVVRVKPDSVLRVFLCLVLVIAGLAFTRGGGALFAGDFPVIVAFVVGVGFFVLKDAFAPARPVLVVQTAAGSTAVVTLPDPEQLRHIAGLIVWAIDDPSVEIAVEVKLFGARSRASDHGPVVHMRGRANLGISYR